MDDSERETDGGVAAGPAGSDPGLEEEVLYEVVRRAVEDAILNAAGTLLLVAVALGFVGVAGGLAVSAASAGSTGWALLGGLVAVGTAYVVADVLGVVPSARDLF